MSITPDQIPDLKVYRTLAIPAGETSERPQDLEARDEVNIRWNKTFNDLDIYVDGAWERLIDILKIRETYMTQADYRDGSSTAYILALHESVNNLFLEVQELRQSLGVDLMSSRAEVKI